MQEENKLKYYYEIFVLGMLLAFICCTNLYPQDKRIWPNPEIKLGYQFGGGFVFGLELAQSEKMLGK